MYVTVKEVFEALSAYPLGVAGFIKTIEVVAVEAAPVPALFTADTRNT